MAESFLAFILGNHRKESAIQEFILNTVDEIAKKSVEVLRGKRIAISGGSTFNTLFDTWSQNSRLKNMDFYPVDERRVPFEDSGCNWKVACEKLFAPLGMDGQLEHWATSKAQYEMLLKKDLGPEMVFDQVFLGMGDDGHTASLFPCGQYLTDSEASVLETVSPKAPYPRLSLGLKTIWSAKELFLIVWGSNKKAMVQRMLGGDESLPITLALKGHPNPVVIREKNKDE